MPLYPGALQQETPALRDIGAGHFVACHFAEQLTLRGAVARI